MKWLKRLAKSFVQGKIDQFHDWKDPDREEDPMACPEIVMEGIDGELYAKLLAQATAAGAQFNGTEATFKGCTFDWLYTPEEGVLHVTCTSKPFYFSCKLIQTQIEELVAKSKEAI